MATEDTTPAADEPADMPGMSIGEYTRSQGVTPPTTTPGISVQNYLQQQQQSAEKTPQTAGAPIQSFDPKELGRVAVRGVASGAIGAISFIPDIAVEAEHMIDPYIQSLSKATGIPAGDPVMKPSDYMGSLLDKYLPPSSSRAGRLTEQGISLLSMGGMGRVAERALNEAPATLARLTQASSKITSRAAHAAMGAGYKLSPSYVGGRVARQLQTWGGGPKTSEEISAFNEAVTDNLAKHDLHLSPNSELDEGTLDALRKENYEPYEEVRQLGTRATSQEYRDAINAAGGRFAERGPSFGGSRFPEVTGEKAPYMRDQFDVSDAVDEIRMLRRLSRQNLKTYNPAANAVGYTQREISNALEDEIERMVKKAQEPDPFRVAQARRYGATVPIPAVRADVMQRLKASRRALAKIANIEDALGAGGHVRASDLKRLVDKGVPLDGGLKTIADAYKNFRQDLQAISEKGERGTWSAVDYLLGGTGILTGEPMAAAASFARPLLRWGVRTERVQQRMLRGLAERATPREPGQVKQAAKEVSKSFGYGVGMSAMESDFE